MSPYEPMMKELLQLAKASKGATSPNPMVAAAVVLNSEIIATGVHQKAGEPHAERIALQKAGPKAKGATLLVTLEPCTHHGKTLPCTDAIIEAGIKEVIYACNDPNPTVQNQGGAQKLLSENGIQVSRGLCEDAAITLNEIFFKNIRETKPFIAIKIAQSQDGKCTDASGTGGQITNETAQQFSHKLRREYDGILVGVGTVLTDNPRLDIRHNQTTNDSRNPIPIIIDPNQKTPANAALFDPKREQAPLILTQTDSEGALDWEAALQAIYEAGITSVLIEGGPTVWNSALDANVVDKVYQITSPTSIGGNAKDALSQHNYTQLSKGEETDLDGDTLKVVYTKNATLN